MSEKIQSFSDINSKWLWLSIFIKPVQNKEIYECNKSLLYMFTKEYKMWTLEVLFTSVKMLCRNKRLLLLCFSTVVILILLWQWRIGMTKSLNLNMNHQVVDLFDLNEVPILYEPSCSSSVGNRDIKFLRRS